MIERATAAPSTAEATVPRHLAIIMDGNRRWAAERALPAIEGHRQGARALREIAAACARAGIAHLTVFAFSEENWQRGPAEVGPLMELVRSFARTEARRLARSGIRVRLLGRPDRLPEATRIALDELVSGTAACEGMTLNLAVDYGARTELCDAVRALANDVATGRLNGATIDENTLSGYLYTAGTPDPDLLIRTGGELRVSNFLLYQIAYAELWATTTHWPDFTPELLHGALEAFSLRQRRFGR
ncbi:MAG: polyprenyl diphosphate synthase [Candidatus Baltobacteraceae bacterium]